MTTMMMRRTGALRVVLLLASITVTVAALWNNQGQNNSTMTSSNSEWMEEIWNLPSDVPFPGAGWLNRLEGASPYTHTDGTVYSSYYAALFQNDPLAEPCRNLNAYINSIFLPDSVVTYVASKVSSMTLAHYILCYLRNFVLALIVYYTTAGIFHYFCYIHPMGSVVYEKRKRPESHVIWHQIRLATAGMTIYTMLPVIDEALIEHGWTQAYYTLQQIGGWGPAIFFFFVYMTLVEIGVYWMHRTLHTNKWMYKNLHLMHHVYNKPETLTPWASIAFHPIDGMLQASPYLGAILVCPCHYLTHLILLFFTALWATYIHDSMDFNIEPMMGSKYHTVHHTHYVYNYGQIFTFCDRFWGTLRVPVEPTGVGKQKLIRPGYEGKEE